MLARCLVLSLLVSAVAGCGDGEKDLIDDKLSSEDQIRSLVDQFQAAAASDDDEAACDLMDEQMRSNAEGTRALIDGKSVVLPCGVLAALWGPAKQRASLPTARVVHIEISRHDDTADVQLDNGTRLFLRRAGTNADGEWRIDSFGYRPLPADELAGQPGGASPSSQPRIVRACGTVEALGSTLNVDIVEGRLPATCSEAQEVVTAYLTRSGGRQESEIPPPVEVRGKTWHCNKSRPDGVGWEYHCDRLKEGDASFLESYVDIGAGRRFCNRNIRASCFQRSAPADQVADASTGAGRPCTVRQRKNLALKPGEGCVSAVVADKLPPSTPTTQP